jgi:hypothetical protein
MQRERNQLPLLVNITGNHAKVERICFICTLDLYQLLFMHLSGEIMGLVRDR